MNDKPLESPPSQTQKLRRRNSIQSFTSLFNKKVGTEPTLNKEPMTLSPTVKTEKGSFKDQDKDVVEKSEKKAIQKILYEDRPFNVEHLLQTNAGKLAITEYCNKTYNAAPLNCLNDIEKLESMINNDESNTSSIHEEYGKIIDNYISEDSANEINIGEANEYTGIKTSRETIIGARDGSVQEIKDQLEGLKKHLFDNIKTVFVTSTDFTEFQKQFPKN